ncbi:MAG: hypothetical protein R3C46_06785 [Hyphomonadaceae bacterium]
MRIGWIAGALAALGLLAPAAAAQANSRVCANTEFAARTQPLDEFGPFGGASFKAEPYHDVKGPACRIITFYRIPAPLPDARTPAEIRRVYQEYAGKTAPPFFAARYVDDSRAAKYQARWTDQDRCPALVTAIEKLEPVLAPKLTGDGPYRDMAGGEGDQPIVRFWMTTQVWPQTDPDYTQNYAVDGGAVSALGDWLGETFQALDACWSAEPPVLP